MIFSSTIMRTNNEMMKTVRMSVNLFTYSADVMATEAALMEVDHPQAATTVRSVIIGRVPAEITVLWALMAVARITIRPLRTTTPMHHHHLIHHLARTLIRPPPELQVLTPTGAAAAPVKNVPITDGNLTNDDHLHRLLMGLEWSHFSSPP